MEPWSPTDRDLAQFFDDLRAYRCAVLAVSGGADSMALLHLAARWVQMLGPHAPRIRVATVDHGLRPGARDDARLVVEEAERLGFPAVVLEWLGEKPVKGVQAQARQARYDLLGRHAAATGCVPTAVVTAHTQDDQAETLLMRLARGSGPDGLQGMRPVRRLAPFDGVDLVRPLLGVPRSALRSYLGMAGGRWVEDPSNADERFERVRLRAASPVMEGLGLIPPMLALAARRQQRGVDALETMTDRLAERALTLNGGTFAQIAGPMFHAEPMEMRVRLLMRVLAIFGGRSPPAELAQVEHLADDLSREGAVRTTLGGCDVRACHAEIRIFRERGRARLVPVDLAAGEDVTWDDRFVIRVLNARRPVNIRPLDPAAYAALKRYARSRLLLPARAAATLPAVWSGDSLIAVGGLGQEFIPALPAGEDTRIETRFMFLPRGAGA